MKFWESVIIAIAVVVGSHFLSVGLMHVPIHMYAVEVRGVSERVVESDHVLAELTLKEFGDDFDLVRTQLLKKADVLLNFLKQEGFTDQEIISESLESGFSAWDAPSKDDKKSYKVKLNKLIKISTRNAQKLFKTLRKKEVLAEQRILVDDKVSYFYNQFNSVKNEMIHEATQNARKGAEQFAKDSNAVVGKIVDAKQGLFAVETYADEGDTTGFHKKIRVVNTVKFELQ